MMSSEIARYSTVATRYDSNARKVWLSISLTAWVSSTTPMAIARLLFLNSEMLWYFGISSLLPDNLQSWLSEHNAEALFSIVALGLCQAAYFSEDLRSGLRSIPDGQAEAARALGHGFVGSMRHVLMPQAIRNAVPALVNHSVSLFKNSSLAMAIGVVELTHAVKEIESQTFRAFESYLVATVLYLAISLLIMAGGAWLGRRYSVAGAR